MSFKGLYTKSRMGWFVASLKSERYIAPYVQFLFMGAHKFEFLTRVPTRKRVRIITAVANQWS